MDAPLLLFFKMLFKLFFIFIFLYSYPTLSPWIWILVGLFISTSICNYEILVILGLDFNFFFFSVPVWTLRISKLINIEKNTMSDPHPILFISNIVPILRNERGLDKYPYLRIDSFLANCNYHHCKNQFEL